ncbi:hypothetical protein C8J57DRAFT_1195939, partial [Mycena rebaudengoi]
MNPSAPNRLCVVCGRAARLWCSRCQAIFYCSPEHLRDDWPRRRPQCYPRDNAYGSNMIATPLPAEPEYMSGSAITFIADEPPTSAKPIPDVVQLYPARLFIYKNLYFLVNKISAEDTFQQILRRHYVDVSDPDAFWALVKS